jgi:hypothetical protein
MSLKNVFEKLPDEVVIYIFSFLDVLQVWQTISAVCRQWHAIARSECYWATTGVSRKISIENSLSFCKSLETIKILFNPFSTYTLAQLFTSLGRPTRSTTLTSDVPLIASLASKSTKKARGHLLAIFFRGNLEKLGLNQNFSDAIRKARDHPRDAKTYMYLALVKGIFDLYEIDMELKKTFLEYSGDIRDGDVIEFCRKRFQEPSRKVGVELSNELWSMIFSYVNVLDLWVNVRAVSKRFNALVQMPPYASQAQLPALGVIAGSFGDLHAHHNPDYSIFQRCTRLPCASRSFERILKKRPNVFVQKFREAEQKMVGDNAQYSVLCRELDAVFLKVGFKPIDRTLMKFDGQEIHWRRRAKQKIFSLEKEKIFSKEALLKLDVTSYYYLRLMVFVYQRFRLDLGIRQYFKHFLMRSKGDLCSAKRNFCVNRGENETIDFVLKHLCLSDSMIRDQIAYYREQASLRRALAVWKRRLV